MEEQNEEDEKAEFEEEYGNEEMNERKSRFREEFEQGIVVARLPEEVVHGDLERLLDWVGQRVGN
jgi:hypothetical protein